MYFFSKPSFNEACEPKLISSSGDKEKNQTSLILRNELSTEQKHTHECKNKYILISHISTTPEVNFPQPGTKRLKHHAPR